MFFKKTKLFYILTAVFIILLIGLIVSYKLYSNSQKTLKTLGKKDKAIATPPTLAPSAIKNLIKKVDKHFNLPRENPKIITVSNVGDLKKTQAFFETAKNGDQLLVYSQIVILYDPIIDKIKDVAHIRLTPSPQSP